MKETPTDATRSRAIIDSMSAPAYLLDCSWNIAYTNRESLPQPDVSLESVRGGDVMDLIEQIIAPDEESGAFRQAIKTVCDESTTDEFPVVIELDTNTPTGTVTREFRIAPCELGGETGVIVVSEAVVDPRSQELARYERLCETLPVAVWISSPEAQGQFEFVNEAAVDMFDADSKADLKTHSRQGLYANADEQTELWEQIVADGAVAGYETVLLTLDEEAIWGSVTAELTEIDGQKKIIGIIENVTDRKQKERALQEERAFIDGIVDGLSDIFYTFDTEWSLIEYNEEASAVTGYDHAELESMAPWDFFPDGEQETIRAAVEELIDTEEQIDSLEAHLQTKDGDEIPYAFSMSPFYDANGTLIGFVGIGRDITDRKESERKLKRQNERLEKFTSVISHDLRNPIGIAEGYVDRAEATGDAEDFQTIRTALGRMDSMIEELLTMASADTIVEEREPIELVVLAHEAWQTAQTEDATLELMVDSEARITGDRELLLNVFENLFRNAVDHNEPPLTVRVGTLDSGRSGFYIKDDGDGVPEDAREEIFDHGHTTSDDGTGLGLYIVNELVTAHGWEISVTGGRDGGARFEVETETQERA